MRIAFLSDIHANFPALKAALESARRLRASRIVFAGDAAGEGCHPVEVVRFLAAEKIPSIRGNQDRKILEKGRNPDHLRKLTEKRKVRKALLAWTALRLDDEARAWLSGLPELSA